MKYKKMRPHISDTLIATLIKKTLIPAVTAAVAGAIFMVMASAVSLRANEPARDFIDGIRHYRSGNHEAAATDFLNVAASGVASGELFYNLGNAHLKNGQIGRAILWYERARQWIPNDPDLVFNLEHARSFVTDEKPEGTPLIYKIIFFWNHRLGDQWIIWMAVGANLAFWAVLVGLKTRRRTIVKMRVASLMTLAAIFVSTALYNYYQSEYRKEGIVLLTRVSVRSGLSEESTELFVLHAGTKIKIEKQMKNHFRIYFSDGKIGWVSQNDIGVI